MNLKKAKLLDKIMSKFAGNITVKWTDLQNGLWNDIETYYVCENNIKFLVGDGMLERDNVLRTLVMTDKGFAIMTDPENLGYVAKVKKERFDNRVRYLALGITTATFFILVYNNFIKPKNSGDLNNNTTKEILGQERPSRIVSDSVHLDSTQAIQKK